MATAQDLWKGETPASEMGLVSADSHVNEPRDLWSSNLPASMREQAMEGIESGEDGSWNAVFHGQHVFKRDMASEAERLAVLDPDPKGLIDLGIPVDHLMFGSYFPHPEGMANPLAYAEMVKDLSMGQQELIMGGRSRRR